MEIKFIAPDIEMKTKFDKFLSSKNSQDELSAFGTYFIWSECYGTKIHMDENFALIKTDKNDLNYCFPMGKLSDDKLRNLKYHLIVTIALITRCCIEGGMEMETAYNLSDIYIRNVDACRTENDIQQLHLEVIEDFTKRMQSVHKTTLFSKPIVICLDYIYDHLHTKISLEELAEQAGLSSSYLSRLFHKEVGVTISQYITGKRIQAAENLLKYSEYSFIEITNYLCFSSESHFIHTFKKYTGYTPKVYREIFFRSHWKQN